MAERVYTLSPLHISRNTMVQFNSETNNLDLVSEIRLLTSDDADSTEYVLNDIVRRVNAALELAVGWILEADGDWQYDDTNHTDLPVGTIDLVDAQQTYSFTEEYLAIEKIKVKDANGFWHILDPIDHREYRTTALEEAFPNDGLPRHYDKLTDDTIALYPAPKTSDVTITAGLKIHFKRTVNLFNKDDTTQEPGLPPQYHTMLAYMAAIPYCQAYKRDRVVGYQNMVAEYKTQLIEHYARRDKDSEVGFETEHIDFE